MSMHLTWSDIENCCQSIALAVRLKNIEIVVPIIRGGLIPGAIIASMLSIKRVMPINIQFRDGNQPSDADLEQWREITNMDGKILVVDDIIDTGHTMAALYGVSENAWNPSKVFYSAMVLNHACEFSPRGVMFGVPMNKEVTPDMWVYFPWDATEGK